MKEIRETIQAYEMLAGMQYAVLDSYVVMVEEQLTHSAGKKELVEVALEVVDLQRGARNQWIALNIKLSDMVEQAYQMPYWEFQLSNLSITHSEKYRSTIRKFQSRMDEIQRIAFSGDVDKHQKKLSALVDSLNDLMPKTDGIASPFSIQVEVAIMANTLSTSKTKKKQD